MGFNSRTIINSAIDGVLHGALVVAGKAGVRVVRRQFGYAAGSVVGSGVEAAAALAIGMFGARVLGADKARSLMHGGFSAPIEAIVKSARLPYVSDALGDSGMTDTQVVFLPADASGRPLSGYEDAPSLLSGYADAPNAYTRAGALLPVAVQ